MKKFGGCTVVNLNFKLAPDPIEKSNLLLRD